LHRGEYGTRGADAARIARGARFRAPKKLLKKCAEVDAGAEFRARRAHLRSSYRFVDRALHVARASVSRM
jgi:hypothetical protein